MSLTPAALMLHQQLLRLAKGMLRAWEDYVRASAPPLNPSSASGAGSGDPHTDVPDRRL